jgi:hypothetical protein
MVKSKGIPSVWHPAKGQRAGEFHSKQSYGRATRRMYYWGTSTRS